MYDWMKKYPWLWAPDDIDGDGSEKYCTIECLPDGWIKAFGEEMCKEIDKEIKRSKLDDMYVVQAKEKYGELVIFFSHHTPAINDILRKYEEISTHVCDRCGRPDVNMINLNHWLSVYCEECYEKHLRRGGKLYKDVVVGEAKMPDKIYWRRYSKNGDEHFEMDISETTRKIRERYAERKANGEFDRQDNFDGDENYYGA